MRFGLRTVGPAFAIANAALTLATIGALAVGAWYVQRTSALTEASTRRMLAARELRIDLLEYHRASNLLLDAEEPAVARERAYRLRMLRLRLESVETADRRRRPRLPLRERRRSEARQLPLAEVLRSTRPSIDVALSALRRAERAGSREHDAVEARTRGLVRAINTGAIVAAVLLAAGWVAFLVGLRRHVTQPILSLHAVAERIRRGTAGGRSSAARERPRSWRRRSTP
ncbi:MAG: hypothetical protein M5U28_29215 [Sandaracinaceae bacterium]|nr:hypothetical protein [Sandaracinaceae bacterium]